MTITVTIDPREEDIASLHRAATAMKDSGDVDKAIYALQKAQKLMRESSFSHTTESWLRLPLFLQQGGKFDEAMVEFDRLLDDTDARIADEFSHQPEFIQHGATHHVRATIYDKMRLACKRQKLSEYAAEYEVLRDKYRKEHQRYIKKLELYRKRESAKHEKDCAARRGV